MTYTGLMERDQCLVLEELAAMVPGDQAIVEIGSYKGQSTCHLAIGSLLGQSARIWAVDPWDLPGNVSGRHGFADPATRAAFLDQIEPFKEWITPVQSFSVDAAKDWRGPAIGLLYIDGDHARTSVYNDFYAWRPYLATAGVVVFDDYGTPRNPGVGQAVRAIQRVSHLVRVHVRAARLAVGIVP